jgi:hypothetical protein
VIRDGRLFRCAARVALALMLWAPAAAAQEGMTLRLVVHRPGTVRMDGRDLTDLTGGGGGPAPVPWRHYVMQLITIPPGRHQLILRPADLLALPPWEEQVVEGVAGDTVTAVLGRPILGTSPSGAQVRVAGEPAGVTPVPVDPTQLPGAAVSFDLPGYQPVTVGGDSILVVARETGSYRLELAWTGGPPTAAPVAPARPGPWWVRHRTAALGGSLALLAGGVYAGFRLKDQADEQFDAYLRTGNRQRQADLFGRAERLDRLALVGWGIAEVAFLASFFLLIHEEPRGMVPKPFVAPAPTGDGVQLRVGVSRAF